MKYGYIVYIAVLVSILSCTEMRIFPSSKDDREMRLRDCPPFKNHRIPYSTAVSFLAQFFDNPRGGEFESNSKCATGIYIPWKSLEKALLKDSANKSLFNNATSGWLFYPCIDNDVITEHNYIAFNPKSKICEPNQYEEFAIHDDSLFYCAFHRIHLIPTGNTIEINEQLDSVHIPVGEFTKPSKDVYGQKINRHNERFLSYFNSQRGDVVYGTGFIQYAFIDSLTNHNIRPTSGFCCFLGYDNTLEFERVRMVFLGVDTLGKLIIGTNAYCVEKSWPPK